MLAEGKVVHREVGSEGSRRQNADLRNTNRISGCIIRASLRDKGEGREVFPYPDFRTNCFIYLRTSSYVEVSYGKIKRAQ